MNFIGWCCRLSNFSTGTRVMICLCSLWSFHMIVSCRSGDDKIAFVEIENEVYTVRWLFKKPFESDWTNHWMMEGDSVKATAER